MEHEGKNIKALTAERETAWEGMSLERGGNFLVREQCSTDFMTFSKMLIIVGDMSKEK